jgi:outer membrane protein OmpA-like peptidoglycan-associated protein
MMTRRGGHFLGLAALAALWVAVPLAAGEDAVGTTAANFLKIPPPARPAAMGQAFTAISDDESALTYNPAGVARALQDELSLTHIDWFQGIFVEHLGTILGLGPAGTVGLGVTWLNAGDIVRTTRINNDPNNPLGNYTENGTFQPYDLGITAAYAFEPWAQWNAGVDVRVLQQAIDSDQGWGFNLDLGVQRTGLWDWLDLGLVAQNLGSQITVGSTPFNEPLAFTGGAAARFLRRQLTLSVDVNMPMDNSVVPGVGAEYWIANTLALRGGWRGGYASQPTLGAGFRVNLFLLDYAWQPYAELGPTHRITASLVWGSPGAEVKALRPLLGPQGEAQWRQGGFKLLPARPEAVTHWELEVFEPNGQVARTFQGSGPAPATVAWDGRDSQGQVLPDGVVQARLRLDYTGGLHAEAVGAPVELDSTPPGVAAAIQPIIARPNSQGAVLIPAHVAIQAQDKHGIGGWKLEIHDAKDQVFRAYSGDGPPPADVVWDGTDGQGRYVDSGTTYFFWPFAKDRLGNWAKGQPQALIVLLKELHFDIASDALFEPGKADVRISAYHQLFDVKELILKHHQAGTVVDILGHTDNEPTVYSVYKSNQELSLARAKAVVKFLVDLLDMDPQILNPVGMGDSRPKASNDTVEGRLANRRVEVVIHAKEYR